MEVIAFNGSPRKGWNTATLLEKALEGAASKGAKTKLVHLYDLDYKGCVSCFACKVKGGRSYGRCAVDDALAPVFKQIEAADAIILGSPIYVGTVTGEMHSFMERLLYQYLYYANPPQSLAPKKLKAAFIYTMNQPEDQAAAFGYPQHFALNERLTSLIFGSCETLASYDTLQFDDYSKFVAPRFDPAAKAKIRKEVFPKDCQKAFDLGARLAS